MCEVYFDIALCELDEAISTYRQSALESSQDAENLSNMKSQYPLHTKKL